MWDLHTTTDMRLLLLVCLLTWPGITSADETSFVTVAEGDDAVLPCSLSSKENIEQMIFDWKKDGDDVFLYDKGTHRPFKERVSLFQDELKFGNASIKIRNTELADNGSYTCIFPDKQKSYITLYVDADLKERPVPGAARQPAVTSLNQTRDWTLLQCEVQGVPEPKVEWQDSAGNILSAREPKVTKCESRFCIILQINVTKTENYMCVATQEKIFHRINQTISVFVQGNKTEEKNGSEETWRYLIIAFVLGVLVGIPGTLFVYKALTICKNSKYSNRDQLPDQAASEDTSGQQLRETP